MSTYVARIALCFFVFFTQSIVADTENIFESTDHLIPGETYLFLGTRSKDSIREIHFDHRNLVIESSYLKKEVNHVFVALSPGRYQLSKVVFTEGEEDELWGKAWQINLIEGKINYVGHIEANGASRGNHNGPTLANNASLALDFLLETMTKEQLQGLLKYSGPGEDVLFSKVLVP